MRFIASSARRMGRSLFLLGLVSVMPVAVHAQSNGGGTTTIPEDATVESLFNDFLHYARLGRFAMAEAYAKALLAHPDLDPVALLKIADRDRKSVRTLRILAKNSSIGDDAKRVLEILDAGQAGQKTESERIRANIAQLGGDPQQEFYAQQHLARSGEYAVPPMIATLLNPDKADLHPRVIRALPKIGKGAVNPLVEALQMGNHDVRLHVISALGEIGYPQAIPYLSAVTVNDAMPPESKNAARDAIRRIESLAGRSIAGSPADQFFTLGDKFFEEDESVKADPRLDEANVWYWEADSQSLVPVAVPTRIFGPVMAMRTSERALVLKEDHAQALALWLASNIRREARLGYDVESGDPNETGEADPTRPDVFPRALYFTQAAGPRYAHDVLDRAVNAKDAAVALGAIEALRLTAGESSLVGSESYKQPLVQAMKFPNLVVRLRSALALGAALPESSFSGSDLVMPLLGDALTLQGTSQFVVIDGDQSNLNRIMDVLRAADGKVVGEANAYKALGRVRSEFQGLDGAFVASDIAGPALSVLHSQMRSEARFAQTPLVILVNGDDSAEADALAAKDPYTTAVAGAADGAAMLDALKRVQSGTQQTSLNADLAMEIALQAAHTLRAIAADGRTVFDVTKAEAGLESALSVDDEELQVAAAGALALIDTPSAQRAISMVGLEKSNVPTLRIAAFSSLAESARRHGNALEDRQIAALIGVAKEEQDLEVRTAASKALGALNLGTNRASEIIRSFHGG